MRIKDTSQTIEKERHMSRKTHLVTGGAGFIGSALVRRLISEGNQVRVFDNESRGSITRLSGVRGSFEFVEGDIRNAGMVDLATRGVDSVCHLAFVNGTEFFYTKPELVLEVGVKGMTNVIDACLKHNVRELIVASSSEVYQHPPTIPTDERAPLSIPDPFNPRYSYAAGKILSEIMTINYGRKYFDRALIFRPHNVYGPNMGWEHVIPQLVLRMKELCRTTTDVIRLPIQGTGRETRAFVFIEDFIDGLMQVIKHGKHMEIYNIGTMEEIEIQKVAQMIGEYFGRNIEIVPSDPASGGTRRRCPDITKLSALGYRPRYSFQEGLKVTARWYDENAHLSPNQTSK
jgi:nucleoside-diphosphate-sugar epimerase